jgi:hypothetical protein
VAAFLTDEDRFVANKVIALQQKILLRKGSAVHNCKKLYVSWCDKKKPWIVAFFLLSLENGILRVVPFPQ